MTAYSNYGAALAGYTVQQVSGEPFDQYAERHLYAPLAMAHSSFRQPPPASLAADVAVGYDEAGQLAGWANVPSYASTYANALYDGEGHRVEQVSTSNDTPTPSVGQLSRLGSRDSRREGLPWRTSQNTSRCATIA